MTLITFQNDKFVMRDGKVGTEQDCCCEGVCLVLGEWRIVDSDENVWFSGDIDIVGEQQWWGAIYNRYRLLDFPAGCFNDTQPYPDPAFPFEAPKAYLYRSLEATLRLQVLGCTENWFTLHQFKPFAFGQCVRINMYCGFPQSDWNPSALPERCGCFIDKGTGEIIPLDPNDPSPTRPCKRCVLREFAPSKFGWGLGHLTTGRAVTFTGAVDEEGSNLANWEDANGNSPASMFPDHTTDVVINANLTSWAFSKYMSVKSITVNNCLFQAIIATDTLTVNGGTIGRVTPVSEGPVNGQCPQSEARFVHITADTAVFNNGHNQGTIIANSVSFLDRSVNEGRIRSDSVAIVNSVNASGGHISGRLSWEYWDGEVGSSIGNWIGTYQPTTCTVLRTLDGLGMDVGNGKTSYIPGAGTIVGTCTFTDTTGGSGRVCGDNAWWGWPGNTQEWTGNIGGTIEGDCTFGDKTIALFGTITGNCSFNDGAWADDATINGNCTFTNNSRLRGGTLVGTSHSWINSCIGPNGGNITGDCTFDASEYNGEFPPQTITGNATFSNGSTFRAGNVTGTATLDATSCVVAGGLATAGTFVPDPPPECP